MGVGGGSKRLKGWFGALFREELSNFKWAFASFCNILCIYILFIFVFISGVLEGGSTGQDGMVSSISNVTNTLIAFVSNNTPVKVDTHKYALHTVD